MADLNGELLYIAINIARKIQIPILEKKFLKSNTSRKYGNKLLAVSLSALGVIPKINPAINIRVVLAIFLERELLPGVLILSKNILTYSLLPKPI